jgi:hypothetical protein
MTSPRPKKVICYNVCRRVVKYNKLGIILVDSPLVGHAENKLQQVVMMIVLLSFGLPIPFS